MRARGLYILEYPFLAGQKIREGNCLRGVRVALGKTKKSVAESGENPYDMVLRILTPALVRLAMYTDMPSVGDGWIVGSFAEGQVFVDSRGQLWAQRGELRRRVLTVLAAGSVAIGAHWYYGPLTVAWPLFGSVAVGVSAVASSSKIVKLALWGLTGTLLLLALGFVAQSFGFGHRRATVSGGANIALAIGLLVLSVGVWFGARRWIVRGRCAGTEAIVTRVKSYIEQGKVARAKRGQVSED